MEPDSPPSRLRHEQQSQQDLHAGEQARQAHAGLEFANAEDLLRHDRAATPLPDALESRLKNTLAAETPPPRPWWKRWLGS